ncbi:MAG TPA: hypothetical protein VMF13_04660, partial [Luteitalea sp.]|nr:hypothetical protein [Luteitalea sp.]
DVVATPSTRPFYAFRSGPLAAICLHTGEDKPDSHPSFGGRVAFDALRQEQADWLAGVIQEPAFRDAPYRMVFCHIPLRWLDESPQDYAATGFDRHSGRSRAAWHRSLVEWRTQLVVSGHTHTGTPGCRRPPSSRTGRWWVADPGRKWRHGCSAPPTRSS